MCHLELSGNEVFNNFYSLKRLVLLGPSNLPRFPECLYSRLFFILYRRFNLFQSKHRIMKKRILHFLLFSSEHSLTLNSLSNLLKQIFNKLFIVMATPFLMYLCNNREHFFIFQAKIYKNINYFII